MPTQCSFAFVGTSDWTSGWVTEAGKDWGVIIARMEVVTVSKGS